MIILQRLKIIGISSSNNIIDRKIKFTPSEIISGGVNL